jgi:hypothetical protein
MTVRLRAIPCQSARASPWRSWRWTSDLPIRHTSPPLQAIDGRDPGTVRERLLTLALRIEAHWQFSTRPLDQPAPSCLQLLEGTGMVETLWAGRFPKSDFISLLDVNRRFNLAESTAQDLRFADVIALCGGMDVLGDLMRLSPPRARRSVCSCWPLKSAGRVMRWSLRPHVSHRRGIRSRLPGPGSLNIDWRSMTITACPPLRLFRCSVSGPDL